MKILNTFYLTAYLVIAGCIFSMPATAQNYTLQNSASQMEVLGTSNIHDWELEAESIKGNMEVSLDENTLKQINKLQLSVVSEGLKSGKSGMDKNTFQALDTDAYKNITYNLKKVENISSKGNGTYTVKTTGDLNIAGCTKTVSMIFDAKVITGKITLNGEKEINMTDFKIDPPTALFGTITTGEKVTIKFNTTFTK